MPTPSLILVPARFKTGKLYTPVATTSGALVLGASGDFNVTRASTATRVNASGLIESVAIDVPRLDYPLGGGCPALLVEGGNITNLALHSRDLSNPVWSGTTVTIVKNAVGADGTASGATTITATAASGTVLQATSHSSQFRIFSAYIRRVSGTGDIQLTTNGGTNWDTVTVTSGYTQVASVARTVASGTVGIRLAASGDVIEVDFCQSEGKQAATSPIPTTTTQITRIADLVEATGAVSGCIGQTQGTFYLNLSYVAAGSDTSVRWIALSGSTNAIGLGVDNNNAVNSVVNGQNDILAGTNTTSPFKIAWGYDASGVVCFINGTQYTLTNGGAEVITSLDSFIINMSTTGALRSAQNRIYAVALYTTRLTNQELAALTTL
jgi:hypothetical protein